MSRPPLGESSTLGLHISVIRGCHGRGFHTAVRTAPVVLGMVTSALLQARHSAP